MASLSSWLRLCCMLKLIDGFKGYVLLAANVDDFRNIAKEILPEALAEKLASLASNKPMKQARVGDEESEYDYDSEEDDFNKNERDSLSLETYTRDSLKSTDKSLYVKSRGSRINFEELVEKVKERLAKELNDELQKRLLKSKTNDEDRNEKEEKDKYIDNRGNYKFDKTYAYNKYAYKQYSEDKRVFINNDQSEKTKNPNNRQDFTHDPYHEKLNFNNMDNGRGRLQVSEEIESSNINDNFKGKNKIKHWEQYKIQNEGNKEGSVNKKINNKKVLDEIDTPKKNINNDYGERYVYDEDETQKHDSKLKNEFNEEQNIPVREINSKQSFLKPTNTINQKLEVAENTEHYNQFDLISKGKNDSYEDYEIPKKEQSIYESDERTTKQSNKRDRFKTTKSYLSRDRNSRFEVKKNVYLKNVKPFTDLKDEYESETTKSHREQEIKAKTESLWFNDDRSREENIPKAPTFQKYETRKAKGTMIPTREFYKVMSPNYYVSIPTVAEKYDSNEPLPEKDREREYIKYFVNPPASINKKVRLI